MSSGSRAAAVQRAAQRIERYLGRSDTTPLVVEGNALEVLRALPADCIDMVLTSPPYWGQRRYSGGGIGQERDPRAYVAALVAIFAEVYRVLKPSGSLWLNLGDTYRSKNLVGIPWRVALGLTDEVGFTLRNDVIWNKIKGGPDNARDKLRQVHEYVFHFVRRPQGYYYDVDAIRSRPGESRVVAGAVVSATGVSGVRYRRQIELSTALGPAEKKAAQRALQEMLDAVRRGELADFRMIIRGQQRTTHSDSTAVSGRARDLERQGFYFLRYHPSGSKPGDVWDILPEDTQRRAAHFAPFPPDLCRIPLLATCPPGGVVLDPFCGTGTTLLVARELGRRSIGIEMAREYVELTRRRIARG